MKGKKLDIRPFTRQFYRGNGVCFVFSLWETLLSAIGNLLISWLMQQLIDQIGGYDTGFSLAELAGKENKRKRPVIAEIQEETQSEEEQPAKKTTAAKRKTTAAKK